MYKKIKEIRNIVPNSEIIISNKKKIIAQINKNDRNEYSLIIIDLETLESKQKPIDQRYSLAVNITDNSILYIDYKEDVAVFNIEEKVIKKNSFLENIRVNPFRYQKDYLVYEYLNITNKKGGVFQFSKGQPLFEIDNFFPFGFFDGYLFDLSSGLGGFIKLFNHKTGDLIWEFKLIGVLVGIEEVEEIKVHLIRVWRQELLIQLGSIFLISLNMLSGKLIGFIDLRKQIKLPFFEFNYQNYVLFNDKLCMLHSFYYMEIDLNKKDITVIKPLMIGMTRAELKKSYSYTVVSKIEQNICFLAKKGKSEPTFMGVFDREVQSVIWSIDLEKPLVSLPVSNRNILGIMDSERTLHLFRKTEN